MSDPGGVGGERSEHLAGLRRDELAAVWVRLLKMRGAYADLGDALLEVEEEFRRRMWDRIQEDAGHGHRVAIPPEWLAPAPPTPGKPRRRIRLPKPRP